MKAFFKKLVGRDDESKQKKAAQAAAAAQQEESKQRPRPQCNPPNHVEAAFKCWNDHCQTEVCQSCAQPPNENREILCKLCTISAQNLAGGGDMSFGSDDDETFSPGSNLQKVAHVTFDQRTSQVVGWESIWAIIEGEEAEKDLLV